MGEFIRFLAAGFPSEYLLAEFPFDEAGFGRLDDRREIPVFGDELLRRLIPDPGDAGEIVATIPA